MKSKRGKGSHVVLLHPDGREAVVPTHGSRDLKRVTVKTIVEGVGMGPEDLRKPP